MSTSRIELLVSEIRPDPTEIFSLDGSAPRKPRSIYTFRRRSRRVIRVFILLSRNESDGMKERTNVPLLPKKSITDINMLSMGFGKVFLSPCL